jgi:hypothetical protein
MLIESQIKGVEPMLMGLQIVLKEFLEEVVIFVISCKIQLN